MKKNRPVGDWEKLVTPIADNFRVAGTVGYDYCMNPKGALALSKIIIEMARLLDRQGTKVESEQ